jgi:hypothetical protein
MQTSVDLTITNRQLFVAGCGIHILTTREDVNFLTKKLREKGCYSYERCENLKGGVFLLIIRDSALSRSVLQWYVSGLS